jgi:hypothetical protein
MYNFDLEVEHFTDAYQWLLKTYGDEKVRELCFFTPPRVWRMGNANTNFVATSAITINDEDMAIQFKLCWGHIVFSC